MSLDLRLWPSALAVWVATALELRYQLSAPLVVTSGAVAVALAIVTLTRARSRSATTGAMAPNRLTIPAIAFMAAVVIAAIRLGPVISPILQPAAHDVVTTIGVVDSDPHVVEGRVAGVRRMESRVVMTVTLEQWSSPDRAFAAHIPVSLWAPLDSATLLPGTRIAGPATVGPGDPATGTAFSLTMRSAPHVVDPPPWWQIAAGGVRSGLRQAVHGLPTDGAALLPGFVLGDSSTIPADLAADMRAAGLTHLVVVSGTNVSAILSAVLTLSAVLRLRNRATAVVAGIALGAFVILVRPSPSVVRAAGMGSVVILGVIGGGRRSAPATLAAAVLVLVLADPWLAVSLGFALSVAATAGLLMLAPALCDVLQRRLPRAPPRLVEGLAVATAAQLATAPLLVAAGISVGLGSIPANLLAEVVVAPTTVLGVLAALLASVSPVLAHLVAIPAVWGAEWVARVARITAQHATVPIPWPTGMSGGVAAALCGVFVVVLATRRTSIHWRRVRTPIAVGIAVAVVLLGSTPRLIAAADGWPPAGWVAVACDVGQGDAVVLRAGPDSAVVVDTGPSANAVDRCLGDLGIRHVPVVMLTHFHADHVEGLPGVFEGRDVGEVLVSPLAEPSDEVARVNRWCAQRGIAVEPVTAGDARRVGDVSWRLVWPSRLIRGEGSDPNNASLTAIVEVDGARLLLGGDVEPPAQDAIMAAVGPLGVDVIKVPHHGSRKQSAHFAAWSGARAALISVGAHNDYGHPAPQTVAAYRAQGIAVWRTDQDGDLAVVEGANGVAIAARSPPH